LKGDRTPATAVATPHNDRLGQLSPDGRWLAYESDESGRVEIYVVSFPEGKQRSAISKSGGRMVRWSSHGRELSYINSTGILQSVSVSLSGGFRATATTALFPVNAPDNDGFTYAVSSDSTRFLVMQPKKGQQARIHVIMSWAPDAR